MTAIPTHSLVAATSQPAQRVPLQVKNVSEHRNTRPLPLDQQGVRAEWFKRGINESNCALFHASLYPILSKLKDRIQTWLKSNSADASMACDQFVITNFALDVIVLAFEERCQWQPDQSVLDWLASFIPVAYAESDPT